MNRTVFVSLTILCLLSVSSITGLIKVAKADGVTIYLNADGSITPSTTLISTVDNFTYTLNGNVGEVVVDRDNIVIDGNFNWLGGLSMENALVLSDVSNVTVENTQVWTLGTFVRGTYIAQPGVYINYSTNIRLIDNNFTVNVFGVSIQYSNDTIISGNSIFINKTSALALDTSQWEGITMEYSFGNVISDNNITNCGLGIVLTSSSYNTLSSNNVANNTRGIGLYSSSGNTLSGNNVTANNGTGIYVSSSSNCTLSGNTVANNWWGIVLTNSSSNALSGNNVANSQYGIELSSSSNNNNIGGNDATANTYYGIFLDFSSNNTVNNNNATANGNDGIILTGSANNTVNGNTATSNSAVADGIFLGGSSNNTVSGNNATGNANLGIGLDDSSYNTVSGNNITKNGIGIYVQSSSNNTIYYNNFVGNVAQTSFVSTSVGNAWDDGYPSGGNYWSDYNGTDVQNGPYQNETGSDGIGDTPYLIDANNTDRYPLMGIFNIYPVPVPLHVTQFNNVTVISNSTITGFLTPISLENLEVTLMFNVTGKQGSTGFCRVSIPTALMNGTLHVSVNGTEVPYTLLPSSNADVSYLYFTYNHSTEQVIILPEFPSSLVLFLFMMATLLAVIIYKKKGVTTS